MSEKAPPSSGKHSSAPVSPFAGVPSGYLTLPPERRRRATRMLYKHTRCGQLTRPPDDLADTLEADPTFYSNLWCQACRRYAPCGAGGEFVWLSDGREVGT